MKTKICALCGQPITSKQNYLSTIEGEYVHESCAMNGGVTRCENCNGLILKKNGRRRCDACEELIYTNDMNSYSTKPVPQFKNYIGENGKEYPARYYGLEMEFNNTSASEVHEKCEELYLDKWIYNKRDGSIIGGVEIVTSPLDRKSVSKLLKDMQPIFDYINDEVGECYKDGAGLHIHVSKKSIAPQDRYKLCILLNNLKTSEERNLLYYLSGRIEIPTNEYYINDHYFKIGSSDRLCPRLTGHTVALNTSNKSTYEFRIFKSSNKPEVLLSYVEMVDTMIDFCHNNGIRDICVEKYITWLKNNTKNKILLEKISKYEEVCGKVLSNSPVLLNEDKIKLLRGVHWSKYLLVMYIISRQGYRDFRKIKLDTDTSNILVSSNFTIPNDDLCNRLNKTLRACLVKEILKEQKEIEECA